MSVWIILILSLLFFSAPGGAEEISELLASSKASLLDNRYEDALTTAQKAVSKDPHDYRGQYFLGCAYMGLGKYSEAEAAAIRAYSYAPRASEQVPKKLLDTIRERAQKSASPPANETESEVAPKAVLVPDEDEVLEEEAEKNIDEGFYHKAAELYRDAWKKSYTHPRYALNSADIFANRLKGDNLLDAAKLLREVLEKFPETPEAEAATRELSNLSGGLKEISAKLVQWAVGRTDYKDSVNDLYWAKIADPDNAEIYYQRARLAAFQSDPSDLMAALKEMSRRRMDFDRYIPQMPHIAEFEKNIEFASFLKDLTGRKLVIEWPKCKDCTDGKVGGRYVDCHLCNGKGISHNTGREIIFCKRCNSGKIQSEVNCDQCKGSGKIRAVRLGS